MPALRARQMLSFPCGVFLAKYKNVLAQYLDKKKSLLIYVWGITCLVFMAITQLDAVKQMPYLLLNLMAILTCFPMAVGLLVLGKVYSNVSENGILSTVGTISYEIYLIHAFTLRIIAPSMMSIIKFAIVTVLIAWLTYRCWSVIIGKNYSYAKNGWRM